MPRPESVRVIINAPSGVSDKGEAQRRLAEIFDEAGIQADISIAQSGAEVAELAQAAVGDSWPVIVAAGGDGTVNAVASALVGSDKILGVLSLGTLNHFARDLNIPPVLEAAAYTIIAGHTIKIDVGEVNGHIFLNNSSIGLYPRIVEEREKRQRLGFGKWPAFVWAAVAALRRYPLFHVRLSAKGKEFDLRTPFVFVGNNEYAMEGFNIVRRERLDKAQLSLYVTNRISRLGLVRLALRALLGHVREDKDFLALQTREVKIKTRHRTLRVAFDGEVQLLQTPLLYQTRPGALRVIVPAEKE